MTLLDPASVRKLMVRATNWVGDAVMSLPALRAIRGRFPNARLSVVARPWVAGVYAREKYIDQVIPYTARGWRERLGFGLWLARQDFDCAILLQNAFDAAAMAWLAGARTRIGYRRDGRGWLLTHPVAVPESGEIPRHESFYYLELLRRTGLIDSFPAFDAIRFDSIEEIRESGRKNLQILDLEGPFIGVSPGAAYGQAKRWPARAFAEAAARIGRDLGGTVLLFGSRDERPLAEEVAAALRTESIAVRNFAGETSLTGFMDYAAHCRVFLTNDSGAMHIASALGTPTVTIFGPTDEAATGPTGDRARVVREPVECAPCLLRECPIDHRCMSGVSPEAVARAALEIAWTHEPKS